MVFSARKSWLAFELISMQDTITLKKLENPENPRKSIQRVKLFINSTWPYLNEISPYFIHKIKTNDYNVLVVNVFAALLNEIPAQKKRLIQCALYYWEVRVCNLFSFKWFCETVIFEHFKFLRLMSMLCQTEWSWELRTWSHDEFAWYSINFSPLLL